jgi:hypothetical protein
MHLRLRAFSALTADASIFPHDSESSERVKEDFYRRAVLPVSSPNIISASIEISLRPKLVERSLHYIPVRRTLAILNAVTPPLSECVSFIVLDLTSASRLKLS